MTEGEKQQQATDVTEGQGVVDGGGSLQCGLFKDEMLIGSAPERELLVEPRWLFYQTSDGYNTPLYAQFSIFNRNRYPVIWCIKLKPSDRIFKASHAFGILKAWQKQDIKLYVLPCEDWPMDVLEYVHRRIHICIENLRIEPPPPRAKNDAEAAAIAKEIFKISQRDFPLERMYTKINVVLQRCEEPR